MSKSVKFSPEVQERAVRMVVESRGQHESQWAAIESIAAKIECTAETLRCCRRRRPACWPVRRHERDTGQSQGVTTAEAQRVKELELEVRELRRTNEIRKPASAFFAQAELDCRPSTRPAAIAILSSRPCRPDSSQGASTIPGQFSHMLVRNVSQKFDNMSYSYSEASISA